MLKIIFSYKNGNDDNKISSDDDDDGGDGDGDDDDDEGSCDYKTMMNDDYFNHRGDQRRCQV